MRVIDSVVIAPEPRPVTPLFHLFIKHGARHALMLKYVIMV